jgi:hypothetical protein
LSVIFAIRADGRLPVRVDADLEGDGAAANLAVLYILLVCDGTIDEYFDHLAAVGALDSVGFEHLQYS